MGRAIKLAAVRLSSFQRLPPGQRVKVRIHVTWGVEVPRCLGGGNVAPGGSMMVVIRAVRGRENLGSLMWLVTETDRR